MASLYERLNSINPIRKAAPSLELPADCLMRETRIELGQMDLALFSLNVISDMSKGGVKAGFLPKDLLFFDTETTGLSRGAGTIAFLVGYGRIEESHLVVTQVLMRDYPQEALLLNDFISRFNDSRCLISYNGQSFDLPLLQGRLTMNRLRADLDKIPHLDLLHIARRVFKLRLGRVPLTKLEESLLNITRDNDLPGAQVPARYFEYLEKRDEGLLEEVLLHNCQDIISLARLYLHIAGLFMSPEALSHHQDLFSIARAYEGMGQRERAISCYRACSDKTVRDLARFRLAEIYRKSRMDEEAEQGFLTLTKEGAVSARVFIGLAKIYEHRYREPRRALEITRQGMVYCLERYGETANQLADFQDLEGRVKRLMRKVENER